LIQLTDNGSLKWVEKSGVWEAGEATYKSDVVYVATFKHVTLWLYHRFPATQKIIVLDLLDDNGNVRESICDPKNLVQLLESVQCKTSNVVNKFLHELMQE